MVKRHWSAVFFKQAICCQAPIKSAWQHQLDLIQLSDKSQWLCKLLSRDTWLGVRTDAELELAERLAALVAQELGLSSAAYRPENDGFLLCLEQGQRGLIIPYCEGETSDELSECQAFILGAKLADLHLLKPSLVGGRAFPPIALPEIQNSASWLVKLIDEVNHYRNYQQEHWLLSHRDLHAGNIIWRTEEQPHLIDWESAGLIHPLVELLGLASNCAGLAFGCFDSQKFHATLEGYGQRRGKLPVSDTILWLISLHSWLLWYSYCLRRGWQEESERTLETLVLIRAKMAEMQQIYTELQPLFRNESNGNETN